MNASPKTTKAGTVSTLTWSINNPIDTCSLKAYSDNASDAIRLNALLSTTTLTNKTDANDPYGNRSMLEALTQTTTNSTKAMGKKSVTINYTTDFELKCTVPAPSANPTNRIRVQVTNENEG